MLGPLGLLNLLETRLGLLRAECTQAQRMTQYRECLKRGDTSDRFYHASFEVDPLGTSASLLSWRDSWYLHGWNGEAPPGASVRIADMAALERIARNLLFPSIGERLAQMAEPLSRQQSQIEQLELIDPIEAFPKRWRAVLAKLSVQSIQTYGPSADATTVLGKLQIALKSAHEGKKLYGKIDWKDDGSLRVVHAETGLVAARWVARTVASRQGDVAIVAEQGRSLLDATLDAVDVARQGFQVSSPLVPALQVLPLALATLWEPIDVYALLQFLSHPIGPVPSYARRRLAGVIAECPGVGGPRWREVIEEIERLYPERAGDFRKNLAFWIEHPRYSPVQGAPLTVVLERTRGVRDYFGGRLSDQDPIQRAANATGYGQASTVAAALEALAAQGESSLTPMALEALVTQCTGRGAPNFAMQAQVGCVSSVSDPGALVEPFDQVIWWQMGAPSLPGQYPWSRGELEALARVGAEIPHPDQVLAQRGQDWLRPILNTRKQLLLVLPPPGEEMHPLWQEIQWFVEGVRPEPLEDLVTGRANKDLPDVVHASLPRRRRWWKLPPDVKLSLRPCESYSSLNTFLNAPYQWVLKYPAQLNRSNLLEVTDGNRLYGNLAHRLIDQFFRAEGAQALRGDALKDWFSGQFAMVVAEEGAVLLMPGRRTDYESLRSTLGRALEEIQRQFMAAEIEVVEPERDLAGKFPGGALEGKADLVVRNKSGRQAIVDMKYAGANSYQDRLAKNRHLQLALYAQMLHQETGAWPHVSYFILESSRLLSPDSEFFPEARSVQSQITGATPQLWEQFLTAWKWRQSQIDRGVIEVAVEDIEPTSASESPPGALATEELPKAYNEYYWLAGWED